MYPQKTQEAIAVAISNKFRAWVGSNAESAGQRLKTEGYFHISHTPKFKLSTTEPIFTMGSCFAREVESSLIKLGVPLALDGFGVEADQFESWNAETGWGGGVQLGKLSRGALNKYSVHSMTTEIRRVLAEEKYENDGLIEIKDGLWFDPHSSGLRLATYEAAQNNRSKIYSAMSQIKHSSTIFLTLGLTETWTDVKNNLVMNNPLSGGDLRRHKDRFAFHNYNYDEIVPELRGLIELVRSKCNREMRFVLTVSPVPLGVTFTSSDILTASCLSKCTLRTAAAGNSLGI
jgi:GSCFA family